MSYKKLPKNQQESLIKKADKICYQYAKACEELDKLDKELSRVVNLLSAQSLSRDKS